MLVNRISESGRPRSRCRPDTGASFRYRHFALGDAEAPLSFSRVDGLHDPGIHPGYSHQRPRLQHKSDDLGSVPAWMPMLKSRTLAPHCFDNN